jgi:hypothetical protein
MILIRYLLIGLIVYLIVRSLVRFRGGPDKKQDGNKSNDMQASKKVSKEIGEYIDYEEVKK